MGNIAQWGKPCCSDAACGTKAFGLQTAFSRHEAQVTVPAAEAPANYVPAAAVIRRWQALSGIIGRKARAGGSLWLM